MYSISPLNPSSFISLLVVHSVSIHNLQWQEDQDEWDVHAALALLRDLNENDSDGGEEMHILASLLIILILSRNGTR